MKKRNSVYSLALFLLIAGAPATATHHLVELAVNIMPDDILTGTLEEGDNFYYLVTIPENGVLRTYTQGTVDTYGVLMLTDETEIATANDGGENGNFLIEAMVQPGEHLIRVAGFSPFDTGPFNIVTEFTGDSEPVSQPEEPLPVSQKVRSLTGGSTDAGISAGAYADNGTPVYSNLFSTGDFISIIAEVRPDSADVGKNGELIIVILSLTSSGVQWYFLNQDGNFEAWDLGLATLGPAASKEPLEETNAITIFEGELQAGRHRMAVGYQADGGPLIYTAKAINIVVED